MKHTPPQTQIPARTVRSQRAPFGEPVYYLKFRFADRAEYEEAVEVDGDRWPHGGRNV